VVGTNSFLPLKVIYQFQHDYMSSWADALRRSELPQYLPAGRECSGFIFTNLGIGTKLVTVALAGPGHPVRFEFDVSAPGVQLDYQSVEAIEFVDPPRHLIRLHGRWYKERLCL
jgi:hypothetical protein